VIPADFLIEDADLVATCAGAAPRAGAAQGDIAALPRASVASFDGIIVFVGRALDARHELSLTPDATVVSGRGRTVIPGFVDSHTHLVFAGDRRDELQRRLAGATYAEIAASGGGIVKTVAATREASESDLVAAARPRLAAMLAHGTTTAEVKSGYGLDLESELKMLRAIRRLGA
jgi:imidazolonepropionase